MSSIEEVWPVRHCCCLASGWRRCTSSSAVQNSCLDVSTTACRRLRLGNPAVLHCRHGGLLVSTRELHGKRTPCMPVTNSHPAPCKSMCVVASSTRCTQTHPPPSVWCWHVCAVTEGGAVGDLQAAGPVGGGPGAQHGHVWRLRAGGACDSEYIALKLSTSLHFLPIATKGLSTATIVSQALWNTMPCRSRWAARTCGSGPPFLGQGITTND